MKRNLFSAPLARVAQHFGAFATPLSRSGAGDASITETKCELAWIDCGLLGFGVVAVLFQAFILWTSDGSQSTQLISNTMQFGLGLAATLAAARAALRAGWSSRRVWFLATLAMGLYTAGQGLVAYTDYALHLPVLSPWASDPLIFFWVTPLLVAAASDPLESRDGIHWTLILDFAQVGLLAVAWHLFAFGNAAAWSQDPLGMALSEWKVRFGRDLFILGALWLRALASEFEASRITFRRLATFFTAFALADVTYLYLQAVAEVRSGTVLDLMWSLPRLSLIVLATHAVHIPDPEMRRVNKRRRYLLLHVAALVVPLLILVMEVSTPHATSVWETLLACSIAVAGGRVLVTQARQERAVRELLENRNLLSAVIDGTAEPIYLKDLKGRYILFNAAAGAMFDKSMPELLGSTSDDLYAPDVAERITQMDHATIAADAPTCDEVQISVRGQARTFLSRKSPYRAPDGNIAGVLGVATDITELKRGEVALRHWKSRFESALLASGQVMYEFTGGSGKAFFGGAVPGFLGYKPGSLPTTFAGWLQLIHEDDRYSYDKELVAGPDGQRAFRCEYRVRGADGAYRIVVDHGQVVASNDGSRLHITGFVNDVTDARNVQEQLRKSQKLESLGTLSAGIAHDFNNLLTVINGHSELLLSTPRSPELREAIESIREAADRAASLVRQLLVFSRKEVVERHNVELNPVVLGVYKLLRRLIPANVQIRLEMGDHLSCIKADVGQLEQILMNLAVNARDAMPDGGTIAINTSGVALGEPLHALSGDIPPGQYVVLTVSDNGIGMSDEVQRRIFEPFFTTKEAGRGTGLGLATVHGIAKQSEAFVHVVSEPGEGSTFSIYFPRVKGTAVAAKVAANVLPFRSQESILVVEDDTRVRNLIKDVLSTAGFKVAAVDSSEMALAVVNHRPCELNMIVSDVVLPGMNGLDLVGHIRSLNHAAKVLLITGHIEGELIDRVVNEDIPLLRKPFTSGRLLDAVRNVLGR